MTACDTPVPFPVPALPGASAAPTPLVRSLNGVAAVLDSIPELVVIMNRIREIVYANRAATEACCARGLATSLGQRLGDVFGCRNRRDGPGGCGTSEHCRYCAAFSAIGVATSGRSVVQDMRVATESAEAFDLRIHASPFIFDGETFALIVLHDVSAEKRREVLERVFLHDLLNTASSLQSLTELLALDPDRIGLLKDHLVDTALSLVQEITGHRLLLAAERNELTVNRTDVDLARALHAAADAYRHHGVAAGKAIVVEAPARLVARTDETLVHRIVVNLLKNALEASRPGDVVTLGLAACGDAPTLWCHNPAVMPDAVRTQVFQRNFTTKGFGRGLGTYSVRLLAEKFLGGRVRLDSAEGRGTRFEIILPAAPSG